MFRLTLTTTELVTVKYVLRRAAYEDYQRADNLEARLGGGTDDAGLCGLIETYRQDANDAALLAGAIFERAELLSAKEEK